MLLYWILLPIIWVLAHILFRFEVIGRENLKAVRDGRAYVIAPNHIANLDPVLIAITIFDWKRLRILAKEELFKNPLAGWFLRCMGAVSIERGKGDTTTVEKLTNECKNGTGIMIFPEGTRTKTGKLGVIKSGAFVIAAAAGADMLPVRIIYGTKDGRLHLFCKLRIVFGEPIPAADLQIRDQSHKMAELRRMKNRLRDELSSCWLTTPLLCAWPKRQRRNPLHRTTSRSCRNDIPLGPLWEGAPPAGGGGESFAEARSFG